MRLAFLLPFLALSAPGLSPLLAQTSPPPPVARELNAPRIAGVRIDGVIDPAEWGSAATVTDFTEAEPREGARPPVETEVRVGYDDRNLYLAFRAHGDPSAVRATWTERDAVWADDWVGVVLDPYGNSTFGYMLLANAFGVQGDLQRSPQGEDPKFDLLFESAGRLTDAGFEVEMAIPFSSLRFPNRPEQRWRVNFLRNHPRSSRHLITWAPLSRNNSCLLCQNGVLTGMSGVRPGSGLELLPSLVASRSGSLTDPQDPTSFRSGDPTADLGLGAKYSLPSGVTLEATYNPDFSQVESDAAQIDVNSTFALFFPERRPFFQEGSDLFATRINAFYSRSINDPRLATKVTGRAGGLSGGYLGAWDEETPFILPFGERSAIFSGGQSISNVARVRQSFWKDSFVGALVTDRRLEGGGSGTTGGVDLSLRFADIYTLSGQVVGSRTVEPTDSLLTGHLGGIRFGRDGEHSAAFDGERFGGLATAIELSREARHWSWEVDYRDATPAFRADNGFQTRNDFRHASAETGYTLYFDRGWIERLSPGVYGGRIWSFGGEERETFVRPGLSMTLKRQTNIGLGSYFGREVFRGQTFEGLRNASLFVNSNFSESVQVGAAIGRSRTIARNRSVPVLGQGNDVSLWGTLKPLQRLVIQPSFNYANLSDLETRERFYSGYIARTRFNYQFTRELMARAVVQYDDFNERWSLEPLVVYRLNPFSVFYFGSTQAYRGFGDELGLVGTDRQYFLKFQYLLRR